MFNEATAAVFTPAGLHFIFTLVFFFLLGVKSLGPSPTLEGSVQNLELKFCSRATVKCASGTLGAVKVCARTPGVCSCALLKLYCLCRRERVRATRLFFLLFFNVYFYTPSLFSPSQSLSWFISCSVMQLLVFSRGTVVGLWPCVWWQPCYWS